MRSAGSKSYIAICAKNRARFLKIIFAAAEWGSWGEFGTNRKEVGGGVALRLEIEIERAFVFGDVGGEAGGFLAAVFFGDVGDVLFDQVGRGVAGAFGFDEGRGDTDFEAAGGKFRGIRTAGAEGAFVDLARGGIGESDGAFLDGLATIGDFSGNLVARGAAAGIAGGKQRAAESRDQE
jgi:hypothetical protein